MVTFKTQIINSKQNHSNHTIPSLANKFLKSVKTKIHLRYKHSTKSIKNQKQYTYIKVKTKNNYQQSQTLIPTKKNQTFFNFLHFSNQSNPSIQCKHTNPQKNLFFPSKSKKIPNLHQPIIQNQKPISPKPQKTKSQTQIN